MKSPALLVLLTLPALCQAPSFQNEVSIKEEGNVRRIRANGIPDHTPGRFPNAHNPNTIQPQSYNYTVPLKPEKQAQPAAFRMQPFGIAVNGVVFDPFAAEWWRGDPNSGWQYEPQRGAIDLGLDDHNAHVRPNGAYHYHGIPHSLLKRLAGDVEADDAARMGRGWFSDLWTAGSHGRERCSKPAEDDEVRLPRQTGRTSDRWRSRGKLRRLLCSRLRVGGRSWRPRCVQRTHRRDAGVSAGHLLLCAHSARAVGPWMHALEQVSRPINANIIGTGKAAASPFSGRGVPEEHRQNLITMLQDVPADFLKWCARSIVTWEGTTGKAPVHHIHGDNDWVIPHSRLTMPPAKLVPKGAHVLNLSHPEEVNAFVHDVVRSVSSSAG